MIGRQLITGRPPHTVASEFALGDHLRPQYWSTSASLSVVG